MNESSHWNKQGGDEDMNEQETIKYQRERLNRIKLSLMFSPHPENCAHKDERPNAILATELAIAALEKQVPKKPIAYDEPDETIKQYYVCPNPNCEADVVYAIHFYCYKCGQKLDWSE